MTSPRSLTISSAFLSAAARVPNRIAIRFNQREMTYSELDEQSGRLAAGLVKESRCEPGDRVGLLIGNTPEFLVGVLAVARAGLVAVPMAGGSSPRELVRCVEDSQMRCLLADGVAADRLGGELEELVGADVDVHGYDRSIAGAATVDELMSTPRVKSLDLAREDHPFFFGYTSGTTGRPKAAVVSHRARSLLALAYGTEYGCYAPGEVHLIVTPIYHGAGLSRALAPLLSGASIELHERFDAERIVNAFATGGITATFMVPTMFAAVFDLPSHQLGKGQGSVRTILSNASALPEHLKRRILEEWPGVRLFEIYGSTEAGTVASLRPEDQRRKQRCVGLPLPMTNVRLLSESGSEVSDGEIGQLYSGSPFLFSGYHNSPEATTNSIRDGYVTSGDLARRDDEGYLYIVGRVSDVIISGGVNVYPREVEEYLCEHPSIREAAVFGVADPRWGEMVRAALVVGRDAPVPSVVEILDYCRRGLSPAKIPKEWSFLKQLPRTATGKVAVNALRDSSGESIVA